MLIVIEFLVIYSLHLYAFAHVLCFSELNATANPVSEQHSVQIVFYELLPKLLIVTELFKMHVNLDNG